MAESLGGYILIIKSQLKDKVFPLIEGGFCACEGDVPEGEIVVGEKHLQLDIILMDGFVFLLESFGHAQCHLYYPNCYRY